MVILLNLAILCSQKIHYHHLKIYTWTNRHGERVGTQTKSQKLYCVERLTLLLSLLLFSFSLENGVNK